MNMGLYHGFTKYDKIDILPSLKTRKINAIKKAALKKERQYRAKLSLLEREISEVDKRYNLTQNNDFYFQLLELEVEASDIDSVITSYRWLSQDCQEILAERG